MCAWSSLGLQFGLRKTVFILLVLYDRSIKKYAKYRDYPGTRTPAMLTLIRLKKVSSLFVRKLC